MSEQVNYPYATLEKDGYELDVVEFEKGQDPTFLEVPVPSDDERFSVQEGDAVKLIFHYAQPFKAQGKSYSLEHMWVLITSVDKGFLTGYLDNQPHYTNLLTPGQELTFHPEHIIDIWRGE